MQSPVSSRQGGTDVSAPLRLSLACEDYDRTRPLLDGSVRPEGIALTVITLQVEETFFRMLRHREFDVSELSLASYAVSLARDDRPFVAIPIFPSRSFRHQGVFVNADSGIAEPADLRGKVVGVPEWQLTACVWIRGLLADDYGVPLDSVRYRTGGIERPGRPEKLAVDVPAGVDIAPLGDGLTLSDALAGGQIDALYTPRAPSSFLRGDPRVRRLWTDVRAEEAGWFARTGIFPIMHVVALRRDVYERDRWVAQSLYKAFVAARDLAYAKLRETAALSYMLPWLPVELEHTQRLLGTDYWSYGLEPNRAQLDTFLRYHHEQGLSPRRLAPDDLFVPETLEAAVV
jgi:4,5-dihydroxyphthalate decarboxylase